MNGLSEVLLKFCRKFIKACQKFDCNFINNSAEISLMVCRGFFWLDRDFIEVLSQIYLMVCQMFMNDLPEIYERYVRNLWNICHRFVTKVLEYFIGV